MNTAAIIAQMDFGEISPELQEQAAVAIRKRNVAGFLDCASDEAGLAVVVDNVSQLKSLGLYEEALSHALSGTRSYHSHWDLLAIDLLFKDANKTRMRGLGSPIPSGPLTLYRGVSGVGELRRHYGWSWTDSIDVAAWFALRYDLASPTVLSVNVDGSEVYCRINNRSEREYIVKPKVWAVRELVMPMEELRNAAARHMQSIQIDGQDGPTAMS